jgi:hypothetical protein
MQRLKRIAPYVLEHGVKVALIVLFVVAMDKVPGIFARATVQELNAEGHQTSAQFAFGYATAELPPDVEFMYIIPLNQARLIVPEADRTTNIYVARDKYASDGGNTWFVHFYQASGTPGVWKEVLRIRETKLR